MGKDKDNTGGGTTPDSGNPPASSAAKAPKKAPRKVRCKALIHFQMAGRLPDPKDKQDKGTPTVDVSKGEVIYLAEAVAKSRIKLGWVELNKEARA